MSTHTPMRPSGPFQWILDRLRASEHWTLAGSLSAEDRCLAAPSELLRAYPATSVRLLKFAPFAEHCHADFRVRLAQNETRAIEQFGNKLSIWPEQPLHSSDHEVLEAVQQFADELHGQVVVDVSTMPKRWFVPLVRAIIDRPEVHTLIATNSKPEKYSRKPLAEDADSWDPLPGYSYADRGKGATAIVGVGYHPLNLHEFIGECASSGLALKLFLPFPSLHPGFRQNWQFVHALIGEWGGDRPEIVRVPTDDLSLIFDRLIQHSQDGQADALVLAPFGPKALSLAMCLLSIARDRISPELETEIGYTQPKVYVADYSTGIAKLDGIPVVNAYCIRIKDRSLYELPGS